MRCHVIKEFLSQSPQDGVCVIRTNSIFRSVGYILNLVEEARKDFPRLLPGDIEIVTHKDGYARTFGIKFRAWKIEVPEDYRIIRKIAEAS